MRNSKMLIFVPNHLKTKENVYTCSSKNHHLQQDTFLTNIRLNKGVIKQF